MKSLVWLGNNRLTVRDSVDPIPAADEVLVRVACAGICGSDLHIWHGEHPRARPPLVLGHEFSGTVAACGKAVEGFAAGDGVVCYPVIGCGKCDLCRTGREYICGKLGLIGIDRNGGMAEFAAVPARKLHRVPKTVDLPKAALVEPLAVGVHVIARSGLKPGATVGIVGAGPIGLATALMARQAGAEAVFMSDISPLRLSVAEKLGFHAIHAADFAKRLMKETNHQGADIVFEATGIPRAAEGVQRHVRIGGTLVIVGIFPGAIPMDVRDMSFRELTVIGTRHYTPAEFDRAIEILAAGTFDAGLLITEVYPMDQAVDAFHRAMDGRDCVKVLIRGS